MERANEKRNIRDAVVKAEFLQADGVSGATYSSKVILLAIQNALMAAAKEQNA